MKPLRIRITGIKCEELKEITLQDAIKEGFENEWQFMRKFIEINYSKIPKELKPIIQEKIAYAGYSEVAKKWNPEVWVLIFEKVEE